MTKVCKGCTERYPACWGSCKKYKAARAEHEKKKKAAQEQHYNNGVINSVQYHGLKRVKKKK